MPRSHFAAAFALVTLVLAPWLARDAHAQVPETADASLPDIAQARLGPQGPPIVYNPPICVQIGMAACRFMRAHEYGHIALGHLMGVHPQLAELQADCWAATQAAPDELTAAIQAFQVQGMGGDASHGNGLQRARRIYDMRVTGSCHW